VQPVFKRIGSLDEQQVIDEHAALVAKTITDRQRQSEIDARGHAESAASIPSEHSTEKPDGNVYLRST
jgi:hypothetical protein